MDEPTCSVVDPAGHGADGGLTRGMCSMHYQRWKNNGDPLVVKRRAKQAEVCERDDCEEPGFGRGLCLRHYREVQKSERGECSEEGCEEPWFARGLCGKHYDRFKRTGSTADPQPVHRPCSEEGCDGQVVARDWCGKHYRNWRKYGDPKGRPKPEKVLVQCSEEDCEELAVRKNGRCDKHYREELDSRKPPCEAPGCEELHSYIGGLCQRHYDNKRRYGTFEPPVKQPKPEKPRCKYSDSTEGACTKAAYCRGWCEVHYTRWRIHGDPGIVLARKRAPRREPADIDVEAKVCSTCKRRLPLDAFYKRATTPDGLAYRCKDCCRDAYNKRYAEDEDFRAYRRDRDEGYYTRTAERRRQRERDRAFDKYGITEEQFAEMSAAQNGLCAICKRPPQGKTRLSVDHDHETRLVRGLLCDPCNVALGCFEDDTERLQVAIGYLQAAARQGEGQLALFAA